MKNIKKLVGAIFLGWLMCSNAFAVSWNDILLPGSSEVIGIIKALRASPKQWSLSSSQGRKDIMPGKFYALKNHHYKSFVRYGSRDYGINFVWEKNAAKAISFKFKNCSRPGAAIRSNDLVAMYVKKGKWVKYSKRRHGINLKWSSTPVCQFKLHTGSEGQVIAKGMKFALENTKVNDIMVYRKRFWGINIIWLGDRYRPW